MPPSDSDTSKSNSSSSTHERSTRKRTRGAEDESSEVGLPTLSHAERRRQRKLEKLESAGETSVTPARKKQRLVSGTAAAFKKQNRQNSVWVGNLAFKTTSDALRGFFDGVGEITRIHMPMKTGSEDTNMGFAYVDFESADQKIIAITLSEREFHGRRLLIKDGDSFEGRPNAPSLLSAMDANAQSETSDAMKSSEMTPGLSKSAQKILKAQKQPPAPTLFLGNLGFETTETSIKQLFDAHRPRETSKPQTEADTKAEENPISSADKWIRKIRMGTFEDTGKCKGWAFVDFTSIQSATAALIHPKNKTLDGRSLVIEYASPDAVRRGGGILPRNGPVNRNKHERAQGNFVKGSKFVRKDRKSDVALELGQPSVADAEIRTSGETVADPEIKRRAIQKTDGRGARNGKRERQPRTRAAPGAALALAKRESVAIIPPQGNKIVF